MFRRLSRVAILLAAAGVAYAGPIAACVCAPEVMSDMPCCPDDVQPRDDAECAQQSADLHASCDPMPADGVPAGTHDTVPSIAPSAAPLPQLVHGPPPTFTPIRLERLSAPPLYLTTLRLRI